MCGGVWPQRPLPAQDLTLLGATAIEDKLQMVCCMLPNVVCGYARYCVCVCVGSA